MTADFPADGGTRFVVRLPAALGDAAPQRARAKMAEVQYHDLSRGRGQPRVSWHRRKGNAKMPQHMEVDSQVEQYVTEDPRYSGPADARLKDSWVHVRAIIGYLQAHGWDLERAARAYGIPRQAVEAALAYYERYRPLIDARLVANLGAEG